MEEGVAAGIFEGIPHGHAAEVCLPAARTRGDLLRHTFCHDVFMEPANQGLQPPNCELRAGSNPTSSRLHPLGILSSIRTVDRPIHKGTQGLWAWQWQPTERGKLWTQVSRVKQSGGAVESISLNSVISGRAQEERQPRRRCGEISLLCTRQLASGEGSVCLSPFKSPAQRPSVPSLGPSLWSWANWS